MKDNIIVFQSKVENLEKNTKRPKGKQKEKEDKIKNKSNKRKYNNNVFAEEMGWVFQETRRYE